MSRAACHLPCPSFTARVPLPEDPAEDVTWSSIPARAGVYALRDDDDGAIAFAATADLRRQLRGRLDAETAGRRDRELRAATRAIDVLTVGSAFEADWAYLQLARSLTPATYTHACDRWRAWYLHCDADAAFPRFTRTHAPDPPNTPGYWFGPIGERGAAQRVIEIVEDLFDLCRYYDILLETPNGRPCAYKEMGRCPAPCDGTVGMDVYRDAVRDALRFLGRPIDEARGELETTMRTASERLAFEEAAGHQRRWERSAPLARGVLRRLAPLDRFRYVVVDRGEKAKTARLMLVSGGRIEPWADLPLDVERDVLDRIGVALRAAAATRPVDLTPHGIENLGLCAWHLANGDDAAWLPLDETSTDTLRARLAALQSD